VVFVIELCHHLFELLRLGLLVCKVEVLMLVNEDIPIHKVLEPFAIELGFHGADLLSVFASKPGFVKVFKLLPDVIICQVVDDTNVVSKFLGCLTLRI
jgi:hypothetical protein